MFNVLGGVVFLLGYRYIGHQVQPVYTDTPQALYCRSRMGTGNYSRRSVLSCSHGQAKARDRLHLWSDE